MNNNKWEDFIDWSQPLTEEDFWQAIADANDLEYSEIADGDPIEWL
jgi:hypothetical protein